MPTFLSQPSISNKENIYLYSFYISEIHEKRKKKHLLSVLNGGEILMVHWLHAVLGFSIVQAEFF